MAKSLVSCFFDSRCSYRYVTRKLPATNITGNLRTLTTVECRLCTCRTSWLRRPLLEDALHSLGHP